MLTTYSFQNLRRDLSEVLATIISSQPTFISKIPIVGRALNYKHEWVEDVIEPSEDVLAADITDTDTTITVDDGSKFSTGMILGFSGYDEQMKVISVSGDSLTVQRGYGGTTAESMSAGTKVKILYKPAAEGSEPEDSSWDEPGTEFNYTQIFSRTVRVSNTARSSRHLVFEDIIDRAVRDSIIKLGMEMNAAAIFGRRYADPSDPSVPRTMGGVLYFIDKSSGNVHDAAGAELTTDMMNDLLEQIAKRGGQPNLILVGTKQARKISSFNLTSGSAPIVRTRLTDTRTGAAVYEFVGDLPLGMIETIVVDVNMPDDKLLFLDTRRLALVPMDGRSLSDFDATPTGADFTARRVLGEYTLEVRNASQAHGLIKNLA